MNARRQSGARAGVENARGFLRREDAGLTEHVAPLGESLGRDRRDHAVDDQRDVVLSPGTVLDRHLVRAEERRDDVDRLRRADPPDGPQQLQLGLEIQSVAALDLAGRRSAREHLVEAQARVLDELILAGLTRGEHRRHDAAAGSGDLGVGLAAEPATQLAATIARKNGMGVGIDEARHNRHAGGVQDARVCADVHGTRQLGGRPREHDLLAGGRDRAVDDRINRALSRAAARRATGARQQLPAAANDQRCAWA